MTVERSVLDRVHEVYHASGIPRGTRYVLPDRSGWRWRLSPDVRADILTHVEAMTVATPGPGLSERLLGLPVDIDDALPPNSMLLEHTTAPAADLEAAIARVNETIETPQSELDRLAREILGLAEGPERA